MPYSTGMDLLIFLGKVLNKNSWVDLRLGVICETQKFWGWNQVTVSMTLVRKIAVFFFFGGGMKYYPSYMGIIIWSLEFCQFGEFVFLELTLVKGSERQQKVQDGSPENQPLEKEIPNLETIIFRC